MRTLNLTWLKLIKSALVLLGIVVVVTAAVWHQFNNIQIFDDSRDSAAKISQSNGYLIQDCYVSDQSSDQNGNVYNGHITMVLKNINDITKPINDENLGEAITVIVYPGEKLTEKMGIARKYASFKRYDMVKFDFVDHEYKEFQSGYTVTAEPYHFLNPVKIGNMWTGCPKTASL